MKRLNKYDYTVSGQLIWTSFDHGEVTAASMEEAKHLALAELKYNFGKANAALEYCDSTDGFSINFNPECLTITEQPRRGTHSVEDIFRVFLSYAFRTPYLQQVLEEDVHRVLRLLEKGGLPDTMYLGAGEMIDEHYPAHKQDKIDELDDLLKILNGECQVGESCAATLANDYGNDTKNPVIQQDCDQLYTFILATTVNEFIEDFNLD